MAQHRLPILVLLIAAPAAPLLGKASLRTQSDIALISHYESYYSLQSPVSVVLSAAPPRSPSAYNGSHTHTSYRPAYSLSTRLIPASASTGSFTSFQSGGPAPGLKTFPRSASTQAFSHRAAGCQNGSITSSSQSSDESEEPGAAPGHLLARMPRRRSGGGGGGSGGGGGGLVGGGGGGYRSSSLPRHSSGGQYRRSITLPNIQQCEETSSRPASQTSVQLNTWLQSLTGTSYQHHTNNIGEHAHNVS